MSSRNAAIAVAAVTLLLGGSSGVGAAPRASVLDARRSNSHCVVHLEPTLVIGRTVHASPRTVGCFATFARAVLASTDGVVKLPRGASPLDLTQRMLTTATRQSPAAEYVLGIDWEHSYKGGVSVQWTAGGTCFGTNWVLSSVGSTWDNRISSAKGYSGCNEYRHYEHANYGGARLDCTDYCATMGLLNDHTSSEQYRHV